MLTGGREADILAYAEGDGQDRITDLELGIDVIEISGGLVYADLTITDVAGDAEIAFGVSADAIIVEGIAPSALMEHQCEFLS